MPSGTKGTHVWPGGGYGQAQPLQQAATANAGQPVSTLALSCTENDTCLPAASALPAASVSTLPSYTPTSYSPTSALDAGRAHFHVRTGRSRRGATANPAPRLGFLSAS